MKNISYIVEMNLKDFPNSHSLKFKENCSKCGYPIVIHPESGKEWHYDSEKQRLQPLCFKD